MDEKDDWVPLSWHCPNCGTIVTGFKSSDGIVRVECSRCRAVMVRRLKNRHYVRIEVYASKLMNRN